MFFARFKILTLMVQKKYFNEFKVMGPSVGLIINSIILYLKIIIVKHNNVSDLNSQNEVAILKIYMNILIFNFGSA